VVDPGFESFDLGSLYFSRFILEINRLYSFNGNCVKRPPIREDLKVMLYQSQEADNTFITSDGTSPYSSTR
jgi:hypothetical protein